MQLATAVAQGNFSAAIKLLDVAIAAESNASTLASLRVNRGLCNQRLKLWRKALKVRSDDCMILGREASRSPGEASSPGTHVLAGLRRGAN
jgi:hypothetical protein